MKKKTYYLYDSEDKKVYQEIKLTDREAEKHNQGFRMIKSTLQYIDKSQPKN